MTEKVNEATTQHIAGLAKLKLTEAQLPKFRTNRKNSGKTRRAEYKTVRHSQLRN